MAEREANSDPRLSLEERYGDHDGYVEAVKKAVKRLVRKRLLLSEDAEAVIAEAVRATSCDEPRAARSTTHDKLV